MQSYNYSTDKQKENFLIRIGQYDKVYAPDDESENHTDYPYIDTTNNKRFKKVAFEKICTPVKQNNIKQENKVNMKIKTKMNIHMTRTAIK